MVRGCRERPVAVEGSDERPSLDPTSLDEAWLLGRGKLLDDGRNNRSAVDIEGREVGRLVEAQDDQASVGLGGSHLREYFVDVRVEIGQVCSSYNLLDTIFQLAWSNLCVAVDSPAQAASREGGGSTGTRC